MRSIINTAFADMLGKSKIAVLDLASNYTSLSNQLKAEVCERVDDEYGLDVPQLNIVNISLPEDVEKALDTRSSMGIVGDLGAYQQFQMGKAMVSAAENPGGGASDGIGLGVGFAMANQMARGQMGAGPMSGGPMAPPPPPASVWHIAVNGQSQGPFNDQQVLQAIQTGQLTPTTHVWSPQLSGWTQAGQVPQLAGYFGPPTPPPAP
ncbi:MAG: SPFH domain-containing protein [Planctomycetaceae bacterium]